MKYYKNNIKRIEKSLTRSLYNAIYNPIYNKFLLLLILFKLVNRINYDVKDRVSILETGSYRRISKRRMLCIPRNRRKAGTFLFVRFVDLQALCHIRYVQGRFNIFGSL